MTAPFGLNILAQTVRDRTALMTWLTAAQPAAVVCMDDQNLTQQIKKALPDTTVIHRAYNPNDNQWERVTTPADWLSAHVPFAANGVALQLYNEPTPVNLDAFLTFLEGVCRLCPPSVQLAFPNFAVGNPHENDILNGKYDRILRIVCGTRHVLALHEYFVNDIAAEQPFLCGRFNYWLRRARVLQLPAPRIIITEHGRDVGGGMNDGWKGAGWSEAAYYQRLVDAQELVYNETMPVCVFCWGTGAANRWQSFDIQDATTLQKALIAWNNLHPIQEKPPVPPLPVYPPGMYQLTKIPGSYINLRGTPSGQDIGDLRVGDVVTITGATSGEWIEVVTAKNVRGWVSLQGGAVVFTPTSTPTPTFKLYTPFKQYVITSRFNDPRDYSFAPDKKQLHEGIDGIDGLAQKYGSDPTVHVGNAGTVVKVGYDARGYGNYCIVDFGDNWRAWYAHFEAIYVSEGQKVAERQIIGLMGGTGGTSTAPHCHITLTNPTIGLDGYVVPKCVDPAPYLVTW